MWLCTLCLFVFPSQFASPSFRWAWGQNEKRKILPTLDISHFFPLIFFAVGILWVKWHECSRITWLDSTKSFEYNTLVRMPRDHVLCVACDVRWALNACHINEICRYKSVSYQCRWMIGIPSAHQSVGDIVGNKTKTVFTRLTDTYVYGIRSLREMLFVSGIFSITFESLLSSAMCQTTRLRLDYIYYVDDDDCARIYWVLMLLQPISWHMCYLIYWDAVIAWVMGVW